MDGSVDPLRDIETIETELLLADIQGTSKRHERMVKMSKGDKDARVAADEMARLLEHLNNGNPASTFEAKDCPAFAAAWHELGLLTAKKIIYCANVDEDSLAEDNAHVTRLREFAATRNIEVVKICARIEEELQGLSDEEQREMLGAYGIEESGLLRVIHSGYKALGLASYFTAGEKEVRAWTIQDGWKAPQAAGVIHTDFERGFIRAEVIGFDDYVKYKTEAACRTAGVLRTEFIPYPTDVFFIFLCVISTSAIYQYAARFQTRPDIRNNPPLPLPTDFHILRAPLAYGNRVFAEHTLTGTGHVRQYHVEEIFQRCKVRRVAIGNHHIGMPPLGQILGKYLRAVADNLIGY